MINVGAEIKDVSPFCHSAAWSLRYQHSTVAFSIGPVQAPFREGRLRMGGGPLAPSQGHRPACSLWLGNRTPCVEGVLRHVEAASKYLNISKQREAFGPQQDVSLCCSCLPSQTLSSCVPCKTQSSLAFLFINQPFCLFSSFRFYSLRWIFHLNSSIYILSIFRPWQPTHWSLAVVCWRASGIDWPAQGFSGCSSCCCILSSVAACLEFLLPPTSQ